jgi:hypothetical protein
MIVCLYLLAAASWSVAEVPEHQLDEVEHLIDFVRNSDCQMIRNGKRHDAGEAVQHIERKYDHYRNKISNTEEFIAYSATKSLLSGKYYTVRCPNRDEMKVQDWLLEELADYRGS